MNTDQYQQYVDILPKASTSMEHITNFGKIVSRGFILLADTIDRAHARLGHNLVAALGGDTNLSEAARARRAAELAAEEQRLREQLAALEAEKTAAEETPA